MNTDRKQTHDATLRGGGARELARYLTDGIENGDLPPGYKIAAERVLSERFNASRGAVRRVLAELKMRGLITQAVGSGTFVSGARTAAAVQDAGHVSPAQLMEARLLIEPLLPALIVRHATKADFARMDECIARSEAASTVADFEYWDGALHQALAEATHNHFLLQVQALAGKVREQGDWGRLKHDSMTDARRHAYEVQHRAIVEALRQRDQQLAGRLLAQHLEQISQNLFSR